MLIDINIYKYMTSTMITYSVPSNVKLMLFKSKLFENLMNGLNVREYKDDILSNPKPVDAQSYYDILFNINVITIHNSRFDNECRLVQIDNTVKNITQYTFDIYLINIVEQKIKYTYFLSIENIHECKVILERLEEDNYCIFVPGKYIQVAN
jgi:hypothetical protein